VAAFANGKIIAAKSALAVMTRHATQAALRGVMIQGVRRRDLSPLWQARSYLMAFATSHFLMFRMTKAYAKCLGGGSRARVTT